MSSSIGKQCFTNLLHHSQDFELISNLNLLLKEKKTTMKIPSICVCVLADKIEASLESYSYIQIASVIK